MKAFVWVGSVDPFWEGSLGCILSKSGKPIAQQWFHQSVMLNDIRDALIALALEHGYEGQWLGMIPNPRAYKELNELLTV